MKTLIIAEKPSLAKEIASTLGVKANKNSYFESENYIVTFVFGHLMVLKDIDDYKNRGKTPWKLNELPFVPPKFEFKLRDDEGVKKQYGVIEKLIIREDINLIVNAGDADREGEVIVNNVIYSILRKYNLDKEIKRLWLHTQNKEGINKSMSDMKNIKDTSTLYSEGLARTYIDWLYGINLTRYITLKSGDLLPVGRVLIPIVKKVYDRHMEIKNFVPEKYYEVDAIIKKDGAEIKTVLKNAKFTQDQLSEGEALIDSIKGRQFPVSKVTKKMVEKSPKKLFSLTTLQNHMAKKYKIGLDETLKIAQGLYEKGLITYPRTNTEYLTNSEKNDVKKLIDLYKQSDYNLIFKDKKTIFDDSKVESHSALLVTTIRPNMETMKERDRLLYETILNRFISNFLDEKTIVQETKITIEVDDKIIELRGNIIINEGFYKYEKPDQNEKILPPFIKGELVDIDFSLGEKETSKPKNLTVDELNTYLQNPFRSELQEARSKGKKENGNALISEEEEIINKDEIGIKEKMGGQEDIENQDEIEEHVDDYQYYKELLEGIEIGTVATRDSIIKNAQRYDYITIKKTVLDITEKGIYLIETLEKLHIDLSKEKTVESSKTLKSIYRSEMRVADAVLRIQKDLRDIISNNIQIQKRINSNNEFKGKDKRLSIGICPDCGKRIFENSVSYYCEGYNQNPKCNFSLWKTNRNIKSKIVFEDELVKGLLENKKFVIKQENMEVEFLLENKNGKHILLEKIKKN